MRRWVAALFLVLTACYLGASARPRFDCCPDEQNQVCHILCNDGCTAVPLPAAPAPPPPDPMPRPRFEATPLQVVIICAPEPEEDPPRPWNAA